MPRIWDELRYDHNVRCSGKRVRRLMHQLGIKGRHRRRYRKTTQRDASLAVAPDLMNRDFTANKPDEKYVGDIISLRINKPTLEWPQATELAEQITRAIIQPSERQRFGMGRMSDGHSLLGRPRRR